MSCKITEHKIGSFNAITLSNDETSLTILPEKGSDIISLRDEKTETEFLWESPQGLRTDTPSKSFIDNYEGGWQECFPTGGPAVQYYGASMGQHGEVHALKWDLVDAAQTDSEVSITLEVKTIKSPFVLRKKITLRNRVNIVEIDEWVTNLSDESLAVIWGQHPALGGNFLDRNCKIDALADHVFSYTLPENEKTGQFNQNVHGDWPLLENKDGVLVDVSDVPGPEVKRADMLFIDGFNEGWISITNRDRKVGIAYLFDPEIYKTVWFWQMYGGGTGYPWYGRAYTLALEPFTGIPDPHVPNIEQVSGTRKIRGGETLHNRLRVLLYRGIKGVGRISADGVIVPRI